MTIPVTIDQGIFTRFFDSLGRDVAFLNEVVEEFLTSSPGLLATMHQAIAAGEAPALQRAAHSLKTGSATFGAMSFSAQCKALEEIAKSGVLEGAGLKVDLLESSYADVVKALKSQVESVRS